MKFTQILCEHNMHRWKRWQLFMTSRRKVFDDEIYIKMKALNYPLVKATDVVKEDFEYR